MFDQLADYTIPVFHPIVVHFPVALAVLALIPALLWLMRDRVRWLGITLAAEVLAFIGAYVALETGETLEHESEGVTIVDQFVHLHETMAERAMWVIGITCVALIFAAWWGRRDLSRPGVHLGIRIAGFLLVVAAAILIGLTAHIGGIMTWGVPS
ncbi:MAG: hypothetical protein O3A57_11170 [Bacteroidetes bacterium]|nr:hypothetical protein [Bacteroidota bacterium]